MKQLAKKGFLLMYPLIVVLFLWQLAASYLFSDSVLLPSPYKVALSFYKLAVNGTLLINLGSSLFRVITGFLVGSLLGLTLGMLMGRVKHIEIFFSPIVNLLQPIPKIAWIPLAILWFGMGFGATLFIISLAAFWSVLFTTWSGAKSANIYFIRAAESLGAGRMYIFFNVLLPASMPHILSGLRLGIARSWRALVAAELLIATTSGIGYMIFHAREFLRTEEMIVGMLTIGAVGLFIEKVLFRSIERRTMEKWGLYNE